MRRLPLVLAVIAIALCAPAYAADAPAGAPPDDRTAAWQAFRAAFDGGDYAAALPLASQVVDLTQNQFGPQAPELANPLANLATTYYRMRRYGEALDAYRRTLTLLDELGDATDLRLVRPLHGLGATLRALDRADEAIVPLKRAVDIVRNREGLQAPAQLPILGPLVAAYMAAGRIEEAGREQQYAFNVAESTFGREDPRLLGPLDELARWNEAAGRYAAARVLHARAVQLADAAEPGSLKAIPGLRGIARTYRDAYLNGETEEATMVPPEFSQSMLAPSVLRAATAPSTEGERALREALQRLGRHPGTGQAAQRGAVLLDLGNWYAMAGSTPRAQAAWRDAWRELSAAGSAAELEQPALVVYRAPPVAVSRGREDPDDYTEQDVELRLAITAAGEVREAIVANAAPERESAEKAVIAAVKRATWRPAIRNGDAVAVTDHPFRERVNVKRPRAKD